MPRKGPPPGMYTARQAMERLENKMLYKYIEKGLIHPQGSPFSSHKFYPINEIEHIRAIEAAALGEKLHKIDAHFAQTQPSDTQSLYELAVRMFGTGTIGAEKRLAWIEKEPRGNYVLKRNDTNDVVAYFYVQSLSHERIMRYMEECRGSTVTPDDIRKIEPGQHEMIIAGIGRDPRADRQYVSGLLLGVAREFEQWGREGIEISRFYAYSKVIEGVFLCFKMGMELWEPPRYVRGAPYFKFVLDVEKSNSPLLRGYKSGLAAYRRGVRIDTDLTGSQKSATIAIMSPIAKEPAQTSPPRHPLVASPQPQKSSLPEGYVGFREMGRRHGIHENTVKGAIEDGRLQTENGQWVHGRAPVQRAFNREQQTTFVRLYSTDKNLSKKFHQCEYPDCPCHLLPSPSV